MTKVLHVADPFLRISENWIYPQVTQVAGVTPAVLCSARENQDTFPAPGCAFFFDPPPWNRMLGIPRILNSLAFRFGSHGFVAGRSVGRWKPDLIHAHFGMIGFNALELRRRLGVPLVTSFYGMDAWQLPTEQPDWIPQYRVLFREGTLFLVEGPAMRERMVAIGCPRPKIRICRIGVRLNGIPFEPQPVAGPLRILMIGRFIPKKGFEDGLAACVQAVHRGVDAHVTIIGGPSPGDTTGQAIDETLHALAKDPDLEGRIHFAGFVKPDQARELLRKHHVFLCPSKHAPNGDAEGGSPVALTEAMALGLLCIGTRHCDIPEVIRHEETGLLADSGDVTAITDLIEHVAKRPDRVERLRRAGRKHIEQNFHIDTQVQDLRSAYDSCARAAKG